MLAGVLLHVIETPLPVDDTRHLLTHNRPAQNMSNPFPFFHYLGHTDPSQLPGVERLAAGSRIEGGAVKINFLAVRARLHDAGPELRQVTVVIVKALRHCSAICTTLLGTLPTEIG